MIPQIIKPPARRLLELRKILQCRQRLPCRHLIVRVGFQLSTEIVDCRLALGHVLDLLRIETTPTVVSPKPRKTAIGDFEQRVVQLRETLGPVTSQPFFRFSNSEITGRAARVSVFPLSRQAARRSVFLTLQSLPMQYLNFFTRQSVHPGF